MEVAIVDDAGRWDYAISRGSSPAAAIAGVFVAVTFYLLFRIGIGKFASNIVKWLFIAFTVFSLVEVPITWPKTMSIGLSYALIDALSFLLQVFAAWTLFKRDATMWLKGRLREPNLVEDPDGS